MHNWIPTNQLIRFAAGAAFLSLTLYFSFLYVVLKEKKEVEVAYTNTESESAKEERAQAIKSLRDANTESIQTLEAFFIQKGDEVKFIERIEEMGRQSGVKFEITSIEIQDGGDPFKEEVEVGMKIEGSWAAAMRFIDNLEKMPFGVLIESADLNTNDPGVWSGALKFLVFREK